MATNYRENGREEKITEPQTENQCFIYVCWDYIFSLEYRKKKLRKILKATASNK